MDKSSKNNNTEIQLRKINREIWWLETKIDWLRSMVTGRRSESLMEGAMSLFHMRVVVLFLMTLLFVIYILLNIFLMKQFDYDIRHNGYLHILFVIILFFIFCYCWYLLSKKATKKLKFLDKKLIILCKKRRNISDKLKT